MMPDNDNVTNVKNTDLAAKLALCLGLLSRPNTPDLSPLLSAFSKLEKNSQCLSDMMLPLEKIEWNLHYQWSSIRSVHATDYLSQPWIHVILVLRFTWLEFGVKLRLLGIGHVKMLTVIQRSGEHSSYHLQSDCVLAVTDINTDFVGYIQHSDGNCRVPEQTAVNMWRGVYLKAQCI